MHTFWKHQLIIRTVTTAAAKKKSRKYILIYGGFWFSLCYVLTADTFIGNHLFTFGWLVGLFELNLFIFFFECSTWSTRRELKAKKIVNTISKQFVIICILHSVFFSLSFLSLNSILLLCLNLERQREMIKIHWHKIAMFAHRKRLQSSFIYVDGKYCLPRAIGL